MVYQLMFAIITPALITGAFAERVKFSAMLVFMVLWALIVYSPMAHMVWGMGGFLNAARRQVSLPGFRGRHGGACDLAACRALVTALYLGKRVGYPKKAMPPHSVVLSFIGACLLWVGWFGFNAGSALGAGTGWRRQRFVATHFGAAAAALRLAGGGVDPQRQAVARWAAISGAVAGLVAITPASGFVTPMAALWIGLMAGVFCFFMVVKVKNVFGYDDSLDAFGVHGAGGTMGAMLTGLFANSRHQPDLWCRQSHRASSKATGTSCSTRLSAWRLHGGCRLWGHL